jgi:hypothetical protein
MPLPAAGDVDWADELNAYLDQVAAAVDPADTNYYHAFTAPALNTPIQNVTGKTITLSLRVGIVSAPQQNGHSYLEVSPDQVTWVPWAWGAMRNNQTSGTGGGTVQSGGPNLGNGSDLVVEVPAGWWYRLRTSTVAGYSAPTFIYESSAGYYKATGNPPA